MYNKNMKKGLDVSHYQGKVDWDLVKSHGIEFAYVKATEGVSTIDAQFKRNWQVLGDKHLTRGVYHFCHPEMDMGVQGKFFAQTVGALKQGDTVWADVESTHPNGASDTWLHYDEKTRRLKLDHFLESADEEFTKLSGFKVLTGIYTDKGDWEAYFSHEYDHSGRNLWLASLTSHAPDPIKPWKKVKIWQYSFNGKIPGIIGNVDLDYML